MAPKQLLAPSNGKRLLDQVDSLLDVARAKHIRLPMCILISQYHNDLMVTIAIAEVRF